ncbi:MAG: hypothetical protein ABSA75_13455 [Candidatus Bathyarchaeia archaeon]|jgi:hypothetical protein
MATVASINNKKKLLPAVSRDDLLARADHYDIERWSDGLINYIDCFEQNVFIHRSTANYQSDVGNAPTRLQSVNGFLYPEISQDYAEWINFIQPPASSLVNGGANLTPLNTEIPVVSLSGSGYVDYLFIVAQANTDSNKTIFSIYCDGINIYHHNFDNLVQGGVNPSTETFTLLQYVVNGLCSVQILKKFRFNNTFMITGFSPTAGNTLNINGIASLTI